MKRPFTAILFAAFVLLLFLARPAQAGEPVVRAVLFYSPTCGHCHYVMSETLPPLQEEYGEQLQVVTVDVSSVEGNALYTAVLAQYQTPPERTGVPTLIIGETYLVGSQEIPEQLPELIAAGLAAGGLDWPEIAGLEAFVTQQGMQIAPPANEADEANEGPAWLQKFNRDRTANTIAVIVLAALLFSLIASVTLTLSSRPMPAMQSWYSVALLVFALLAIPSIFDLAQTQGLAFVLALIVTGIFAIQIAAPILILAGKGEGPVLKDWFTWAVPLIVIAGITVSTYLAFVEATQAVPACGPVGDCGTVQESEYAMLFGVLPVGVFGLMGNLALLAAWLAKQFGPASLKNLSALALWGMSVFGVLFSAYLTFLEPFVIGATCMWCITSAVTMILMLWVTTPAAKEALGFTGEEDDEDEGEEEVEGLQVAG
ncbi:MAG: vitamin K epoxide reductase family protein [Chloroflexota bacterium]